MPEPPLEKARPDQVETDAEPIVPPPTEPGHAQRTFLDSPAPAHVPVASAPPPAASSPAQPQPTHVPVPAPLPQLPTAPPVPPAAQLGPAFVSLTGAGQPDAPQQLVIRLDPLELGHVQVRIERAPGGPARVNLAVERPDTLMMLLQDRPRLDQALNQAGVPPEGRIVQFSLAAPDSGTGAAPDRSSGGLGSGGAGGGHDAWGGQGQSHGGRHSAPDHRSRPPARVDWLRAGIDITA